MNKERTTKNLSKSIEMITNYQINYYYWALSQVKHFLPPKPSYYYFDYWFEFIYLSVNIYFPTFPFQNVTQPWLYKWTSWLNLSTLAVLAIAEST